MPWDLEGPPHSSPVGAGELLPSTTLQPLQGWNRTGGSPGSRGVAPAALQPQPPSEAWSTSPFLLIGFPVAISPSPLQFRLACCNRSLLRRNSTFLVAMFSSLLQWNLLRCNTTSPVEMCGNFVAKSQHIATDKTESQRRTFSVAIQGSLLQQTLLSCNADFPVATQPSLLQRRLALQQRSLCRDEPPFSVAT